MAPSEGKHSHSSMICKILCRRYEHWGHR